MPTADKVALYTSIAALLLSAVNVVLTSPVLIDVYAKPRLTASEDHRQIEGDNFKTSFTVSNNGFSGARAVEVVLSTHAKDVVQVSPSVSANVEEQPNGGALKTVRIKLKYLAPDEAFSINVSGAKKQLMEDAGNSDADSKTPANGPIPALLNVRCEKGLGTFTNQPPWFYLNAPEVK